MTNDEEEFRAGSPAGGRQREAAYHEAGHAVVAICLGDEVSAIEPCEANRDDLGRWAIIQGKGFDHTHYLEQATTCLAGPVAEILSAMDDRGIDGLEPVDRLLEHLAAREDAVGITEDLQDAWMALSAVCALDLQDDRQASERRAAWRWLAARSLRFVLSCWGIIGRVADEFLAHGAVGGERLREILLTEGLPNPESSASTRHDYW